MRFSMLVLICLVSCNRGPMSIGPADGSTPIDAAVVDAAPVADAARAQGDLSPLCGAPQCPPGLLCQTAQGCCSCGPFARACIAGWTCAVPSANDPRCPATPPGNLTACSLPDGIFCWYCSGGTPNVAACTSAEGRSECQAAGLTRCWSLAGPTFGCD